MGRAQSCLCAHFFSYHPGPAAGGGVGSREPPGNLPGTSDVSAAEASILSGRAAALVACTGLAVGSVSARNAILAAASSTSSGCNGARPFPMMGVIGSNARSTMFRTSPRCPTTPLFLQYNKPSVHTDTGRRSKRASE